MKWLLAIPHYIVLFFLDIAAVVVVIVAWFAILFTGRYPRGMFDFVEGVIRWNNRVARLRTHPGHGPVPAVPAGALSAGTQAAGIRPGRRLPPQAAVTATGGRRAR